ncbi:MAG: relaxase/mobilization nuclease domain-containing protein [Methylococcaceae bacterium]
MAELFEDPIYGKRARNPGHIGRARSTVLAAYHNARKLPQVVIKIAGHINSGSYLKDRIDYLTRDGDIKGQDRGFMEKDADALKVIADKWASDEKGKSGKRLAMHMILSSPKGTDPEKLIEAVKSFQEKTFENHDSFFVIHIDTDYPHAHLMVKTRGYDRKKMHTQKGDFHQWRQDYATELRANGIQVTATSRASRGVTKRYRDRTADKAIKGRGETLKFDPDRDLKPATEETVHKYQEHYRNIGNELLKSKDQNARKMGMEINHYSKSLSQEIEKGQGKQQREDELER